MPGLVYERPPDEGAGLRLRVSLMAQALPLPTDLFELQALQATLTTELQALLAALAHAPPDLQSFYQEAIAEQERLLAAVTSRIQALPIAQPEPIPVGPVQV